jgi:alpha-amylase/alpha-mannosidase (GH57 family)
MTRVALLWHMHQPYYEDLVTREHILPWVRLHALKDYYGMVALLREFPAIRVTFNLVPSLLVQLEAFAADRAKDPFLEVGSREAEELSADDTLFMLQNFFHAQRQRMIDVYPRYAELLALRGPLDTPRDAAAAVRRFGVAERRDLQVWQKLAWIDPFHLEGDERVRGLVAKGRDFSEDDKTLLRAIELELLNAVIPAYRDAAAAGQVELSTSPFYHPILPLLVDTEIYRRNDPQTTLPAHVFAHPEDAAEQLARAVACHERLFQQRPTGLWPSEGSVSDAIVPLVAAAGFDWMATDEMILARTLNVPFTRDASGLLEQPEHLYKAYSLSAGGASVRCAFRDHALSDLIGFTYAGWPADAAAEDFVARLAEAGRSYAARTGGGEAIIPIILDGENAWEHFEGGGRPFLRALYGTLSGHPELRTVTMAEACAETAGSLTSIFPGSWIDGSFYVWIGHRDDHRAWAQLADARAAVAAAGGVDPHTLARAREEVLIAEGSDWFWWYGDDHSSEHDLEFDDLFRRHLRNVYHLIGKPVPGALFVSNISTTAAPAEMEPTGLLTPSLDGEDTSYFEWLGAGVFEARETAGVMHQSDQAGTLLTAIRFGFDDARLYVRFDGSRPLADLLASGFELTLTFLRPDGVRLAVGDRGGRPVGVFSDRAPDQRWVERGSGGAALAAGTILELAVPLADLDSPTPGSAISFFVAVHDKAHVEVERHPAHRAIEVAVPDPGFAARHWTA